MLLLRRLLSMLPKLLVRHQVTRALESKRVD
jgi:hypothetical protein